MKLYREIFSGYPSANADTPGFQPIMRMLQVIRLILESKATRSSEVPPFGYGSEHIFRPEMDKNVSEKQEFFHTYEKFHLLGKWQNELRAKRERADLWTGITRTGVRFGRLK
ncbi:hypothetical protein SAMN05216404_10956 [Nitrosospira multiformis]|uniref:Uncharacterized protein n=1 Tax=Nitrosospira multiformis TaxID=1231 RepID=A0A1H8KUB2_9PROT|nr:hypothetical protein SAMN05216404_10956 [Nitrosospira multiformis]